MDKYDQRRTWAMGRSASGKGGVPARETIELLTRRALVFEHMQDGVIITDLQARIVDWNPAAERIFGYTKEEMIGRTVRRLYRAEGPDELEAAIIAEMESRGCWTGELP